MIEGGSLLFAGGNEAYCFIHALSVRSQAMSWSRKKERLTDLKFLTNERKIAWDISMLPHIKKKSTLHSSLEMDICPLPDMPWRMWAVCISAQYLGCWKELLANTPITPLVFLRDPEKPVKGSGCSHMTSTRNRMVLQFESMSKRLFLGGFYFLIFKMRKSQVPVLRNII